MHSQIQYLAHNTRDPQSFKIVSMTEARKPRIAIPVPTLKDAEYNERSWPQYAHAVEASGGTPVKIPLDAAPAEIAQLAASCEGVLLPGSGADVNPEKYGQEPIPECAPSDPAREAADELLMQDAANLHKPLLGICFGHQSWNVWKGGTLIQHLTAGTNHQPGRQVVDAHRVTIQSDSQLAGILKNVNLSVNSSHHQSIDQPGDGLRVVARSAEDNIIEAVEGTGDHFVLTVQWHPERSFDTDPASQAIFTAFLEAAKNWQPRPILESVAKAQ
jgi:putative glutamine amidotransferase